MVCCSSQRSMWIILIILCAYLVGYFSGRIFTELGTLSLPAALRRTNAVSGATYEDPNSIPSDFGGLLNDIENLPFVRIGLDADEAGHNFYLAKFVDRLFGNYSITRFKMKGVNTSEFTDANLDFIICRQKSSVIYRYATQMRTKALEFRPPMERPLPPKGSSEPLYQNGVLWPREEQYTLVSDQDRPFFVNVIVEPWEHFGHKPKWQEGLKRATYEVWRPCNADLVLTPTREHFYEAKEGYVCPMVHWPLGSRYFYRRSMSDPSDLLITPTLDAKRERQSKVFFGGYMAKSHGCFSEMYRADVLVRTIFYEILNDYKTVIALSNCKKDQERFGNVKVQIDDQDGPMLAYKPFKFVITMENTLSEGWFCEKMFNAILAHSVPIYWGATDVSRYVNIDRIVWCNVTRDVLHDLLMTNVQNQTHAADLIKTWAANRAVRAAFDPCLQEIKHLDENDEAYMEKISQPILPGNTLDHSMMDIDTYAEKVANAIKISNSKLTPSLRKKWQHKEL